MALDRLTLGGTVYVRVAGYPESFGGFGEVHKYRADGTQREYAVKFIYQQSPEQDFLARCVSEATRPQFIHNHEVSRKYASTLGHVIVVHAHGLITQRTNTASLVYAIVTDWIEDDLARVLRAAGGRFADPDQVARLVAVMARAIHLTHACGVRHGDLKPSNTLLRKASERDPGACRITCSQFGFDRWFAPVLTDFGLARSLGSPDGVSQPSAAHSIYGGTDAYKSPELHLNSSNITSSADIYSLGVIIVEFLSGRYPTSEPHEISSVNDCPKLLDVNDDIQFKNTQSMDRLNRVCFRCLRKNPAERYQSAAELAVDLDRCAAGLDPIAAPAFDEELFASEAEFHDFKHASAQKNTRHVKKLLRRSLIVFIPTVSIISILLVISIATALIFKSNSELNAAVASAKTSESNHNKLMADAESTAKTAAQNANLILEARNAEISRLKSLAEARRSERYRQQHLTTTVLLPHLWRAGNHFQLAESLASLEPDSGDEDRRGFEYHYWRRVSDGLRTLKGHSDGVFKLAAPPSGDLLASAGLDRVIRLWDFAAARAVGTLEGHRRPVSAMGFSPDGKQLLSTGCDARDPEQPCEIRLWDVRAKRLSTAATTQLKGAQAAAFCPDGRRVVICGTRRIGAAVTGTVEVRSVPSLDLLGTYDAGPPSISCLAFHPSDPVMATGGYLGMNGPGEVRLWNTSTWKSKTVGDHPRGVSNLAYTGDGGRLLAGGLGPAVQVLDASTGRAQLTLTGHKHVVASVTVSRDGARAATASFDGTAKLWDLGNGRELATFRDHSGFVYDAVFSADDRRLATAGMDGTVRMWDATLGSRCVTAVPTQKAQFTRVAFSHDRRFLAWAGGSLDGRGQVGLWDVIAGKVVFTETDESLAFFEPAFSPDSKTLAVGTGRNGQRDADIRLWDLDTLMPLPPVPGKHWAVRSIAFTPDGHSLAGATLDRTIRMWDVRRQEHVLELTGHKLQNITISVSPDGRLLASGSCKKNPAKSTATDPSTGELAVWSLPSGQNRSFVQLPHGVADLAFSPDSSRLAVASIDEGVHIRSATDGNTLLKLDHTFTTFSLAYSPDGRRLAVGCSDGSVVLWDTDRGHNLLTLSVHAMPVVSIAFSPDGRRLACAGGDGSVVLCDTSLPPE